MSQAVGTLATVGRVETYFKAGVLGCFLVMFMASALVAGVGALQNKQKSSPTAGFDFTVAGVFCLVLVLLVGWTTLVSKSKTVAALAGADDLLGMLRS